MKSKLFSILLISAVSAFGFGVSAYAQDAAEAAPTAADAPAAAEANVAPVSTGKTLKDYWIIGGITMYPLGFGAIAGLALVVYNFMTLRTKKFMDKPDIEALDALLNEQKIEEAIAYCESKGTPLTNIVGAGLVRVNSNELDFESIEAAMQEASLEELTPPYVMVNYLALIASISPMMGLFGTVIGMVKAFDTIANEGAGSAQALANNISEALITTAFGMIVAIPVMFFYFFFKNQYGKVTSGMSHTVGDLMYTLKISNKYGSQK